MNKIYIPQNINSDYYKGTIKDNPEIIPDGFYLGPQDDEYLKNRDELLNNFEYTFLCDEWLDFFCFQTSFTKNKVPIKKILEQIKKYYGNDIPLGYLMIAIKHRAERHTVDANGKILELYIEKNFTNILN